jgi:hypothetical protein
VAKFADVVSTLAVDLGVRQMIALGAYPFATPHTRDPRLSSSSPSADVVDSVAYLKNSVDVPAGMGAVLEHAFTDKGVPSLGIWAHVPHYVSAMSYPAATLALLTGLQEVGGLVVDAAAIRQETIVQRQRLDQLVASSDEHRAMVNQLEARPGQAANRPARHRRASLPATSWPPNSNSSYETRTPGGHHESQRRSQQRARQGGGERQETEAAGYDGAWSVETSARPVPAAAARCRAH